MGAYIAGRTLAGNGRGVIGSSKTSKVSLDIRIAIAVFEGAEELDFAGPWEALGAWRFLSPDDVALVWSAPV
jgi:hypothetical protein